MIKSCSLYVKLKQSIAYTCKKRTCYKRMMKLEPGSNFKLCKECTKLYVEGCRTLYMAYLGITTYWRIR